MEARRGFADIHGHRDGAALSKKTAESLGIEEGDMISWKHVGEKSWCESRVEAIVRTTMSQGIVMKREAYEKTGQSYLPIAVVGDIPAEGFGDYEQTCTISSQKELTRGIEDMMEGMVMMITLLVTGAVLLGELCFIIWVCSPTWSATGSLPP